MAAGTAASAIVWVLLLASLVYSGGLNFLAVTVYNFAVPDGVPSDADHTLWTLALPFSKHVTRKLSAETVGSLDRDASGAAEVSGLPFFAEALPMFLVALLLEVALTALKGESFFSYQATISSLSTGLLNQTAGGLLRVLTIMPYCYIYEHFRIADISDSKLLMWTVAFVGIDFGYYWFHRMAHEVNLLWGFHEVHHSSEEYNLATALRQTVFAGLDGFVFYLPVALLVPPSVHNTHKAFNLLFQFWIHTRHIPKLPWPIEFLFNTPSHHRVHHGRNPWCIDCNYGGTLIVWDRMFGTFCEEREDDAIVYGIVPPLKSFEPWAAELHHLGEIGRRMSKTPASEAAKHIVAGPGRLWVAGKDGKAGRWKDFPVPELGHRANPVATPLRPLPAPLALYTLLSFTVAGAAFLFLALQPSTTTGPGMLALGVASFVGAAVWTIGRLHDRWPAAAVLEPLRAVASLAILAWVALGRTAPDGDGPLDWMSLERMQGLELGLRAALAVLAVQAALSVVVCPLFAAETASEKEAWRVMLAEQAMESKRTFAARTEAAVSAAGEGKKHR